MNRTDSTNVQVGMPTDSTPHTEATIAPEVAAVLDGTSQYAVVCGDATAVMATIPSGIASVAYCDPPYGLSKQDTASIVECLTKWLAGQVYEHGEKGFMSTEWDGHVPGPEAWREVHRALKPGGYCVAFSSTRTVDILGIAIRLAGFEFRNGLAWVQSQGFPKSLNVSVAIEATELTGGSRPEDIRRTSMGDDYEPSGRGRVNYDHGSGSVMNGATERTAPSSDAAKQWDGYGTDVKPAYEPLIVARKELQGTVAANVLAHGCGALNIDAARIGATGARSNGGNGKRDTAALGDYGPTQRVDYGMGRYPASIAFVHDEDCELVGVVKVRGDARQGGGERPNGFVRPGTASGDGVPCAPGHADADGTETVDDWQCTPTCAVAELARQSGERPSTNSCTGMSGQNPGKSSKKTSMFSGLGVEDSGSVYGDTGSAARFFYNAKASANDRLAYVTCSDGCEHHNSVTGVREAKTTARDVTAEQPYGACVACGATRKHYQHPTVKPLSLARHHAKLLSLPAHLAPIALVPFCGTGIEAAALLEAGFRVIAIDLDPRHCAMTEYRLANIGLNADEPKRRVTGKPTAKVAKQTAQLDLFGAK